MNSFQYGFFDEFYKLAMMSYAPSSTAPAQGSADAARITARPTMPATVGNPTLKLMNPLASGVSR